MLAIVKYMMFLGIGALILVAIYAVIIGTGFVSIFDIRHHLPHGAVPVALPAVLAIVQSVGAVEFVEKGVLVTRLDSIEDAASIDFMSGKTGTITPEQAFGR